MTSTAKPRLEAPPQLDTTEAEIDEAIDESFPASDPPAHTTPHPPEPKTPA